jgi:hypothetical protein
LVNHHGEKIVLSSKILHCVFEDYAGLGKHDTSITNDCLHAIMKFLGDDGFWGNVVRKSISFDTEWALVKAYKLN